MKKELRFIHLRVHSEYSLLEGAISLKNLGKYCIDNKMPAVAVTDTNNMFAALEFSTVLSTAGVQPIVGCQMEIISDVEKNKNLLPGILKSNTLGYDGHGQYVLNSLDDVKKKLVFYC